MVDTFSRFTIGTYNDLTFELLEGSLRKANAEHLLGYPFGMNLDLEYSPQILGDLLIWLFQTLFDPFLANNLLIILNVLLTFYVTYKLFEHFEFKKKTNLLLSLSYAFSPYFLYRVISVNQMLYFTFLFPLLFYLHYKKKNPLLLGLFVTFAFYLTNYYGYFCFITLVFLYTSECTLNFFESRTLKSVKDFIKKLTLAVLPVVILVIGLNFVYFINSTHLFGGYTESNLQRKAVAETVPLRNIEGFFSYTFRPWYFFLPPTGNPFLGETSENIFENLEDTGYFLADDYDVQESGGAFLPWHFLILSGLTLYLLFKGKRYFMERKKIIIPLSLTILLILLITGPPFISISGFKIFTPSYLLYYLMPAFRVLVRFSVVIYLLVLILSAFSIDYLLKNTRMKKLTNTFFLSLLVLTVMLQAVKLPVIDKNKPPEYVKYLNKKAGKPVVAVFPNHVHETKFWLPLNKIPLSNPQFFNSKEHNFNSYEFTKSLTTTEGIKRARDLGVDYLLYFDEKIDENYESQVKARSFFEKNLRKEKQLGKTTIYKL